MPNMALVPLHTHVMQSFKDDMHYENVEAAIVEHGRLKQYFSVGLDDNVLLPGDYYLPIPVYCPYSGRRCGGFNCWEYCEYVPRC